MCVAMLIFVSTTVNGLAQQASATEPPTKDLTENPILSGFSWERVPLNIHFAKRTKNLTKKEIKFLAKHSGFICLEKGHGAREHGSTEAGIAHTAKRVTAIRPDAKVLFYFNAFINWPGYEAFDTFSDKWLLKKADGEIVTHSSGTPRPDPSNAEFREWWSDVVAKANRDSPLGGVFIDAIPQGLTPSLAREVGKEKAAQIVAGLREMIAMTKRKLGPDRVVLVKPAVDFN